MDDQRFDRLTRSVATSRRRAVVAVAGAIAAGLGLSAGEARAGGSAPSRRSRVCRSVGASCTRGTQCCTSWCNDRTTPRRLRDRCGCPAGLTACGQTCVDLTNDVANCGACGDACAQAQDICLSGECVCIPNCDGGRCGDDGCGGLCPTCTGEYHYCTDQGACARACDNDDKYCFLSNTDGEIRGPAGCTSSWGQMSGTCTSSAECLAHPSYPTYAGYPTNTEAVCVHVIFLNGELFVPYPDGACIAKAPFTGTCWSGLSDAS